MLKMFSRTYLEKQHEWHPLVVTVITFFFTMFVTNIRMAFYKSGHPIILTRQRKRVRNPAIRIYHVPRHTAIIYTINGIT